VFHNLGRGLVLVPFLIPLELPEQNLQALVRYIPDMLESVMSICRLSVKGISKNLHFIFNVLLLNLKMKVSAKMVNSWIWML